MQKSQLQTQGSLPYGKQILMRYHCFKLGLHHALCFMIFYSYNVLWGRHYHSILLIEHQPRAEAIDTLVIDLIGVQESQFQNLSTTLPAPCQLMNTNVAVYFHKPVRDNFKFTRKKANSLYLTFSQAQRLLGLQILPPVPALHLLMF